MGRDLDQEFPAPRRKPKRQRRQPDRGADACPVLITLSFALAIGVTWLAR